MRNLKICFMLVVFFLTVGVNAFAEDRDAKAMQRFLIANPNSKPTEELVIVPDIFFGVWLRSESGAVYEGPGALVKNNSEGVHTIYPRIRSVIVTNTGSQYKAAGYLDTNSKDFNEITNDVGLDGEIEPGFRKSFILLFKNIDPLAKSLTFKIKDILGEPGSHKAYVFTATYVKLDAIEKYKKVMKTWAPQLTGEGMTDSDWKDLFKKYKNQWGLTDFSLKPEKPSKAVK